MTTRKEAYSFLESYKRKSAKIRLLEIDAQNIESSIHRMTQMLAGDCGGSHESANTQEQMILGFLIIKDQIAREIAAAAEARDKVSEVVGVIEGYNEHCALVLRSRYISFLSVKRTAKELDYSESRVKQLTQEGADNVAIVLSMMEKGTEEAV